jgi:hypothetical protein
MREQETLACLHCGYSLQGLSAHKCESCAQVYLRCPECGTSQVANEAHDRLLRHMRTRAARLPAIIQKLQIVFLIALGVGWTVAGFAGGDSSSQMESTDRLLFALAAGFCAAQVRLLAFRWRNSWLAAVASAAFIAVPLAIGVFFIVAWTNAPRTHLLVYLATTGLGAATGATAAPAIGWLLLWMFARDADRALLTDFNRGTSTPRRFADAPRPQLRHLHYCTHCAAELPALSSSLCDECSLHHVTCPACEKPCGISDSMAGIANLWTITRTATAGLRVAARMVALPILWFMLGDSLYRSIAFLSQIVTYPPAARLSATLRLLLSLNGVSLLVAILTWFIFVRDALAAALLNMLVVLSVGHLLRLDRNDPAGDSALIILALAMAPVSLLASFLAKAVRVLLPKRRAALLEQFVPELARDVAVPSPKGTEAVSPGPRNPG